LYVRVLGVLLQKPLCLLGVVQLHINDIHHLQFVPCVKAAFKHLQLRDILHRDAQNARRRQAQRQAELRRLLVHDRRERILVAGHGFGQRDRRFGGESTLRSPLDGQASA
jgi:hypothetical protein